MALGRGWDVPDWFAAFGSDLDLDAEGRIELTPFESRLRHRSFLADAKKISHGSGGCARLRQLVRLETHKMLGVVRTLAQQRRSAFAGLGF